MKTPHISSLTLFLAGTTAALAFVFGVQALSGTGKLHESLTQAGQELLPEALAGFNANTLDMYYGNYQSWPNSTTLKADDTLAQTLRFLYLNNYTRSTLVDFNGDGLVDMLVHNANVAIDSTHSGQVYGVFLNTGANGFTWVYKCAVIGTSAAAATTTYYGDCAG